MTSKTHPDQPAAALRRVRMRPARGGILVLGGGFAGSYVARRLGPSGATIVNPANFGQARRLARNLRGTPRPYRYRTRGQMATLGRRHGIAVVGGLRVRGLPGWLLARGYHVLQLPFASRRARVLADWTMAAMFRRGVAELTAAGGPNA